VLNESGELIEQVDVFGRGDHVRIDSIPADSAAARLYRGRLNNYRARDPYTNRVAITWYAAGRWRERVLVSEWVVIGDGMVVVFPTLDSVMIATSRPPMVTK
jgi:hypothetical protein